MSLGSIVQDYANLSNKLKYKNFLICFLHLYRELPALLNIQSIFVRWTSARGHVILVPQRHDLHTKGLTDVTWGSLNNMHSQYACDLWYTFKMNLEHHPKTFKLYVRQKFRSAKILFSENSIRRKFRLRKFLRRKFRTRIFLKSDVMAPKVHISYPY